MAWDGKELARKDREATGLDVLGQNEVEEEGTKRNSAGLDDMEQYGSGHDRLGRDDMGRKEIGQAGTEFQLRRKTGRQIKTRCRTGGHDQMEREGR